MSDDKYDKILFDGGDLSIFNFYMEYDNTEEHRQIQMDKQGADSNRAFHNLLKKIDLEIKNKLFFTIIVYLFEGINLEGHKSFNETTKKILYMFREYIIEFMECTRNYYPYGYDDKQKFGNVSIHISRKHNMTVSMLFTIKHFQYSDLLKSSNSYSKPENTYISDIYEQHPEYFMSENDKNITEILETIKKEKEQITISNETINQENKKIVEQKDELNKLILVNERINKNKQNELDKLILENQQKIDHYKSLEQELIKVNKEKELIKEEKRKIAICKEKMAQIKRNLDEKKFKFELEKDRINDVNVNEFINSILN